MNLGHRLPSPTSGVMTTVKAEILKSNLSQMTMLKTEVALVTYPALIILLPRLHLEKKLSITKLVEGMLLAMI